MKNSQKFLIYFETSDYEMVIWFILHESSEICKGIFVAR